MNIGKAEKYIVQALLQAYEENEKRAIAQLVLEDLTLLSRSQLLFNKEETLTPLQEEKLKSILPRLQQHEPVQYVLNKCWFYNLELYVDKSVLIPRPETEELVDWILKDLRAAGYDVFERAPSEADVTRQLKILDVGTGSGCIALALKKAASKAEVWGCDVSEEALNVARRNGASLDIRVDFQGINFLDESQQTFLPSVDILVSNPPYVPVKDKETMQQNVLKNEPHLALFVPDNDALLFYKAIAKFAKKRLYENGVIYLEIHEDVGREVVQLFESEGYKQVELKKDMQGKDRMVKVS